MQEKSRVFGYPPAAQSTARYISEDVSDNNDSLEQSQPKILLKLRKEPNLKLQGVNDTRYCDTCTSTRSVCTKEIRPKDLNDEWSDNDKEEDEYCRNCTHMGLSVCVCVKDQIIQIGYHIASIYLSPR